MPLYEYQCSKCEKVFEVMQKFSDAPLEKCELCSGTVSKLISMSSFSLKGTGWYTTDYKRKAQAPSSSPSAAPSVAATPVSPATPTAPAVVKTPTA